MSGYLLLFDAETARQNWLIFDMEIIPSGRKWNRWAHLAYNRRVQSLALASDLSALSLNCMRNLGFKLIPFCPPCDSDIT